MPVELTYKKCTGQFGFQSPELAKACNNKPYNRAYFCTNCMGWHATNVKNKKSPNKSKKTFNKYGEN